MVREGGVLMVAMAIIVLMRRDGRASYVFRNPVTRELGWIADRERALVMSLEDAAALYLASGLDEFADDVVESITVEELPPADEASP